MGAVGFPTTRLPFRNRVTCKRKSRVICLRSFGIGSDHLESTALGRPSARNSASATSPLPWGIPSAVFCFERNRAMASDPPNSDDDTRRAREARGPRDELAGAFSRVGFDERLAVVFAAAIQSGEAVALIVVDVDHLGDFNARYGRAAGDAALAAIRRRISDTLGANDIVARLAEDEFAVLCRKTTGNYGTQLAQRLRARISTSAIEIRGANDAYFFNVSVGVCLLPASAITNAVDFVAAAEHALRRAKET